MVNPYHTILMVLALMFVGACTHAGKSTPTKAGDNIGTATMSADRTLHLNLRSVGCDGAEAIGSVNYKTDDPHYFEVMKHIGGIKVGESKPVTAWPSEPCYKRR
jgi:hypothetical protein